MTASRARNVHRRAARGLLNRLRIKGKLNLLIALPLTAVVLIAVPFVLTQTDAAASAARTATSAHQAREIGGLVAELQRERLLTAAYLSYAGDSAELTRQQTAVDDAVARVRSSLGEESSPELSTALLRVSSLADIRRTALDRGVLVDSVGRAYHAVVEALIDAVRLVPQETSDAVGTRQLTALEALLRANERHTFRGTALILTATNPESGLLLLDSMTDEAQISTERFVAQADIDQARAVVAVEDSDEGRVVEDLATHAADQRDQEATAAYIQSAYTAVEAQSNLRGGVQDEVTSEIADAAVGRADAARNLAWGIGGGAALLVMLVGLLAAAVSRSIANPMRRLTTAATDVAELAEAELVKVTDTEVADEQVVRITSIQVATRDELGELAGAFNRVQATAARLVERQALTRRNVSLMFANVARRTQSLVGRQLALVDEMERDEQDARLLAGLYQLDHLSTRLRRSADNLLVVAGAKAETTTLAGPTPLAVVLRSALAEIEDYQRVELGEIADVSVVSTLAADLVLLFAELLENATAFSPPEAPVDITTRFTDDGSCLVSVVDHGIGMTEEQLHEENQRLVARERIDIAPTSMLGLFVVGRLARRHYLAVRMFATQGGGVTVRVVIPASRLNQPITNPSRTPIPAAPDDQDWAPTQVIEIPAAEFTPGFSWFPDHQLVPAARRPVADRPVEVAVPRPVAEERGGLRRRVAGAQLPGATSSAAVASPAPTVRLHDPNAARAAFDGFQSGVTRADTEPPDARRGGLTRRVPGSNMAAGLHKSTPNRLLARPDPTWRQRDPEADRAKLDGFMSGLSRAAATTPHSPPKWPTGSDPKKGSSR
jgi:signal transduction histidine kinase